MGYRETKRFAQGQKQVQGLSLERGVQDWELGQFGIFSSLIVFRGLPLTLSGPPPLPMPFHWTELSSSAILPSITFLDSRPAVTFYYFHPPHAMVEREREQDFSQA